MGITLLSRSLTADGRAGRRRVELRPANHRQLDEQPCAHGRGDEGGGGITSKRQGLPRSSRGANRRLACGRLVGCREVHGGHACSIEQTMHRSQKVESGSLNGLCALRGDRPSTRWARCSTRLACVSRGATAVVAAVLVAVGLLQTHVLLSGTRPVGRQRNPWLGDHRAAWFDQASQLPSRSAETLGVLGLAALVVVVLAWRRRWWQVAVARVGARA